MDIIVHQIQTIFGIQIDSISELKGGHINASFFVKEKNGRHSVVQKVNQHVLPLWDRIEHNLINTQTILQNKGCLKIIPSFFLVNGKIHHEHDDFIWRRMEYISGDPQSRFHNPQERAFHASKAFAQFSRNLSPFLHSLEWKEIIPKFHQLEHRRINFERSIISSKKERREQAQEVILGYQNGLIILNKVLPELNLNRITHNDAKVTNVLFRNGHMVDAVVIDLDTVMPGNVMFDLGDLIRTFVPLKPEGDFSASRQVVQSHIMEALRAGFQEGWENQWTREEKQMLPFAGPYMTLLIGLRFLTDYLENDHYFKVEYDNQNLLRAKNQLELFELLL